LSQPGSASTVAAQVNLSRQVVNYHLRELEKVGLLSFVEERKRGNCLERVFQSTAQSYVVSPRALGKVAPKPNQIADRQSADYLLALASQMIADVEATDQDFPPAITLETDVAFASDEDRAAFTRELALAIATLVPKYLRPGARTYRLIACGHPV
jgi:predicted ArsR family transcriptional regulator